MGEDYRKHNKDHYTARGTTPGPEGPLGKFKEELAQERAVLRRDEEHKLPGESPRSGEKRGGAAARKHEGRSSALDRLPKPTGAAGVPASRKPADES
ncbi:hypothetical protein [Vulgatibacter sp.]|uniref:hypothetical protein n=1 Tax=Vulgatibacter sp. TaxID=1971226 RepID=UPI00356A5F9E